MRNLKYMKSLRKSVGSCLWEDQMHGKNVLNILVGFFSHRVCVVMRELFQMLTLTLTKGVLFSHY